MTSAERSEPIETDRGWTGAAGACCASKNATSCRAVGWSNTNVLGSAGASSPSASCSSWRSSTASSESSPASISGVSASTSTPALRATSASTVSSDTVRGLSSSMTSSTTAANVAINGFSRKRRAAANPLEDCRLRATAVIHFAAARAAANSLEALRARANAAIRVAASRAMARSLEGCRARAIAAICVAASRNAARSFEERHIRATAAICVAAAASTAAPSTPPAGSCTDVKEPTVRLQAVTVAAHHPPLSSTKAGATAVARSTGGGTAEDASLAAGVANARVVEGRSAAVSYTSLRAAASSAARVAQRCIFPEVVLGMVFSLTATTRLGASPASLTAAARAARHTAAALFSAAARISKTTTSTSVPPSSTEKAATQPGRTSGHASVMASSTSSG
eukprot:scaffold34633_cov75-Phaeocystis_antarctica.AAC.4